MDVISISFGRDEMGQLRKEKIDQIIKLWERGFTQIEIAEKAGVSVNTAAKYNPKNRSYDELVEDIDYLKQLVLTLWVTLDRVTSRSIPFICPRCQDGKLKVNDKTLSSDCKECGFSLKLPLDVLLPAVQ
jgi:transcriptional regulator with XRE-family HTH domain